MKKTTKILLLIFLASFAIKAVISLFLEGTFFYSDEACVIAKAKYFAETLKIAPCGEIMQAPANDPMPFYSIFISFVYLFSSGKIAYHIILILNSLLISSLIFPLYGILKKFIKSQGLIFLFSTLIIFLPQVVVYEKTILTEAAFITANIWFLYFYLEYLSKTKKNLRFFSIATILAIIAALIRPFGLILLFAMLINEFITAKNKKRILFILLPILLILSTLAITTTNTFTESLLEKIFSITDPNILFMGLKALKDQFNSFIIATFLVPFIIFIDAFFKKTPPLWKKIKFFFLSFIILNYLVSANHMHGYLIEDSRLDLLTRYINMSIVYIYLIAFIFIGVKQKFRLTLPTAALTLLAMISIMFINYARVKHSLNMDITLFYDTSRFLGKNLVKETGFIGFYFFPVAFLLFYALVKNHKKFLLSALAVLIIGQSIGLYLWTYNHSYNTNRKNDIIQLFKNEKSNLLFLQSFSNKFISYNFWGLKTLSENKVDTMYLNHYKKTKTEPDLYSPRAQEILGEYDYILSNISLTLPIYKKTSSEIVLYSPQGENYEEHITILEEQKLPYEPSLTEQK